MTAAALAEKTASPLLAALGDCQRGQWAYSSLYIWMTEHFDEMAAATGSYRVRWSKLAEAAAEEGLRTRKGAPPAPNTVKSTWFRVRRAVTALRERQAQERAKVEAEAMQREAERKASAEAAREAHRRKTEEDEALKERIAQADRAAAWARERDADARSRAQSQNPANAQTRESSLSSTQTPKIGEVKRATKMLEAAPLYGSDALDPPPPPYIGPRPAGLPENVPLEALTSLDASGVKPDGTYDLHNLPGMPRRKFFRKEYEWAQACLPMIRAIPPDERPLSLKVLFALLRSMPGMK